MNIRRVGTITEYSDGTLDMQYWIVDDCDLSSLTEIETQELIEVAKANDTYERQT